METANKYRLERERAVARSITRGAGLSDCAVVKDYNWLSGSAFEENYESFAVDGSPFLRAASGADCTDQNSWDDRCRMGGSEGSYFRITLRELEERAKQACELAPPF